jgi:uncharacterized protein (TIGR00251 family)
MLRETKGGCFLDVEVIPNSEKFGIAGADPWTDRLRLRATESPIRNRVNVELVRELGALLGSRVEVVKGQKTSKKTLLIRADAGIVKKALGL